jgi:hypothetical protein
MTCSSTLNAETTSLGMMRERKQSNTSLVFFYAARYCVKRKLPFVGQDVSSTYLNKVNFVGILNMLKNNGASHENYLILTKVV